MKIALCFALVLCGSLATTGSPVEPSPQALTDAEILQLEQALQSYNALLVLNSVYTDAGDVEVDHSWPFYKALREKAVEAGKGAMVNVFKTIFNYEFWGWFNAHAKDMTIAAVEGYIKIHSGPLGWPAVAAIEYLRHGGFEQMKHAAADALKNAVHKGDNHENLNLILAQQIVAGEPENSNAFMDYMAKEAMKGFLETLIPKPMKEWMERHNAQEKFEALVKHMKERVESFPFLRPLLHWMTGHAHQAAMQVTNDYIQRHG